MKGRELEGMLVVSRRDVGRYICVYRVVENQISQPLLRNISTYIRKKSCYCCCILLYAFNLP